MVIKDFDGVFPHIGGFGRYQMILFAIICVLNCFLAFVYFGQIFMSLTPPHWCQPPEDLQDFNLTEAQLKTLTIPLKGDSDDYESCVRYDVNFTEILLYNESWPDISSPRTTCNYGWVYNYSLYYPTITSEQNWVCDEDWKPVFSQSLFFVGALFGGLIFGWLADAYGRLPIIIITNMIGGIAGVASAYTTTFVAFTSARFIVGLTFDSHFMIAYILILEYVSSKYRTIVSNVPIMVFLTAAMVALPWMGLALGHWSTLTLVLHAPQVFCIFLIWIMPESARWLIGKGKIDKTISTLKKAAQVNGKSLSEDVVQEFREYVEKQKSEASPNRISWLDLLKTPMLRKRFIALCVMWVAILLAYDGHMRNTQNIGSNFFVTFTIAGAVELPADFITMFFMELVGRRHSVAWTLITSGIVSILIIFVKKGSIYVLVMAMIGRFLITMSINVAQQYVLEVLPTVARGQGSAIIHTLGFLSTFVSPYVVYLAKFGHWVPYVTFGIGSVIGGIVCFLLPETLNERLPDSLYDGENFFKNQSMCYNPCAKSTKEEVYIPTIGEVYKVEDEKASIPIHEGQVNTAYESHKF